MPHHQARPLIPAAVLLCVVLSACSESSNPDRSASPITTPSVDPTASPTPDSTTPPATQEQTGQFVDSPVSGVSVQRGGQTALTDSQGRFSYLPGETVAFALGGIELGEASGASFVTPLDLQTANTQAANNLSRFLLTLDADERPGNGLQISEAVRTAAASLSESSSAFAVNAEAFEQSVLADFARQANEDGLRRLRSSADAQTEQDCTDADIADGQYDGDCERGLPQVDAGAAQSATEGEALRLLGSATAQGERSVQRYAWRQLSGPAALIEGALDQNALDVILPQVEQNETLRFRLTVVDSDDLTAVDDVSVNVSDQLPNQIPVVDAGDDIEVLSKSNVELNGSAADPDGQISTTEWRAIEPPQAIELTEVAPNGLRFTAPNVAAATTLQFEFSATDDEGARVADLVAVRVLPAPQNNAPQIDSALADPGVAFSGEGFDLLSSSQDADGDRMYHQWTQLSNDAPMLAIESAMAANAESELPYIDRDTLFQFLFEVSDGALSSQRTVELQAVPDPDPPSPTDCLTAPTQKGCALWTFRDLLAPEDFSNCAPDPSSADCPFSVLADADPGIATCAANPGADNCADTLNNLVDPSYLFESLPPDAPATSCNPAFDAATYEHYIGAWHEHTAYSDGTWGQRPVDMFEQVKARGFDFAASTEHSDTLNPGNPAAVPRGCESDIQADCFIGDLEQPENNVRKWAAILEQAEASTDDDFTAMRGFEWTSDRFGHINVVFSEHVINAKTGAGYAVSMSEFWQWFLLPSSLGGGNDSILSFNHPGREDAIEEYIPDPGYTFNGFRHVPGADYRAVGVEVFGKGSEYDSGGRGGSWMSYALDQGWHLGPTGSEDHHGIDWGGNSLPKTVLIARSRSQFDLKEALLARRFYAVAQEYNDIRVNYLVDGQPMGSRIRASVGTILPVSVTVSRNGQAFPAIVEFVTAGNTIAASLSGAALTHMLTVTDSESYYFLRIRDPQTDRPIAFAAPVWLLPGAEPLPACPASGEPIPLE